MATIYGKSEKNAYWKTVEENKKNWLRGLDDRFVIIKVRGSHPIRNFFFSVHRLFVLITKNSKKYIF